ncbi:MAG TPA: hypothetical protein VHO46_10815, partial [Bacteroidales bacterium]|nr:hypothetical protein [Bacteroidales bacterium]
MRRILLFFSLLFCYHVKFLNAQQPEYPAIDKLLVFGEYEKAADTCRLILSGDSTNAMIWYKLGLAQQNMIPDTGSFRCFVLASANDTANNLYRFTVAKGYIARNRDFKAKPLLQELYSKDSLNWQYASYLTGIYIKEGKYDKAIDIYNRFYSVDSTNYVILDKLGFAYLRKAEYGKAIDFYNKSLAVNPRNIDAIRNLSFLYPFVNNRDTAIVLLSDAIRMDPEDADLYARRATLYFSRSHTKRALDDYLRIMSMGDTTALYLKRAGIGYLNNLQPALAIPFLKKAAARDTTDFETVEYIARCYSNMKDYDRSAFYYKKVISMLKPFKDAMGMTYLSLGSQQKADSLYVEAVSSYTTAYETWGNTGVLMMIANIYDENLNNPEKAVSFYKKFITVSQMSNYPDYIGSIKKRIEYLENKIAEEKA